MASGSSKSAIRWPWLVVAVLGLFGCVLFLGISLRTRKTTASSPAPMSQAREAGPPAAPPQPQPISPPPPPTTTTKSPTTKGPLADSKKPEAPPAPMAEQSGKPATKSGKKDHGARFQAKDDFSDADEAKESKPSLGRMGAPKRGGPPPAKITGATAPGAALGTRSISLDDGKSDSSAPSTTDSSAPPMKPTKPAMKAPGVAKKKPHGKGQPAFANRGEAERRDGERRDSDEPTAVRGGDDDAASEDKALAKLLPGRFSAKVPERMLVNESIRVRATVAEKADEPQAQAILEVAPTGSSGPSKVVTEDVMVGKLLRVELRGLSREFEIQPITPAEQRLRAGRVAQWEWVVVPHEEGKHELSMVVTNLLDWSGRPLDLTVHSAMVSVEVTTMQRLRGYASIVSSIFSGITGLIGAWMALMRPFLKRRQEKEEEAQEKEKLKAKDKPDAEGGKDAGAPPPVVASEGGKPAEIPAEKPPEKPPEKADSQPTSGAPSAS